MIIVRSISNELETRYSNNHMFGMTLLIMYFLATNSDIVDGV
jgi:hypothetical protein